MMQKNNSKPRQDTKQFQLENELKATKHELEKLKKTLSKTAYIVAGVIILVLGYLIFVTGIFSKGYPDGLYMAYACNMDTDRCFTVRASISNGIVPSNKENPDNATYIDKMFFNEGGNMSFTDCIVDSGSCIDDSDKAQWKIEPIKKIGDYRK